MSLSDPLGDMLARIKNSQMRNHKKVEMPSSNFKTKIADVLKNEGYINSFNVENNNNKNILILPIVGHFFKIDKIFFNYKFSIKEIVLLWISQIISVLIFVNLILKNFWGRARPNEVEITATGLTFAADILSEDDEVEVIYMDEQ